MSEPASPTASPSPRSSGTRATPSLGEHGRPVPTGARAAKLGPLSTILHVVGDMTSRSGVAMFVAAGVVIFLLVLARVGFPESWQTEFATVAAAITLVMVFVIQHTQSRQQLATQLKLDELIRASPGADDLLVHVEAADDAELVELEKNQIDHHSSMRNGS